MAAMLEPNARRCPYCGSTAVRGFSAPAYDALPGVDAQVGIVECLDCVFAWQYPVARSLDQSTEIFDRSYTEAAGGYFDPAKRRAVAVLQKQFVQSRVRRGTLLDIGCGDGTFAHSMSESGWRCVGVDPAMPPPSMFGGLGQNLALIRCSEAELPSEMLFDVVTLWDVVEHLDEPSAVISAAGGRVAPGGWLVIETGNYQSTGRIESANRWWNYQLDHRWYFSPPQLMSMLLDIGFSPPIWSERVLRPWWCGRPGVAHPSRIALLKSLRFGPPGAREALRRYRALLHAHRNWPHWAGLEIVTLMSQRPH